MPDWSMVCALMMLRMLWQMNLNSEGELSWQNSSGNEKHFTFPSNDVLYITVTVPFDSLHFVAF